MFPKIELIFGAVLLATVSTAAAAQTAIQVAKTRGCGCCVAWMDRLSDADFLPEGENIGGALIRLKMDRGIPVSIPSGHTATVEGYTIEGHVPPADIRRLLEDRPDAVGLAVPGMPIGSPGMDFGETSDAYDVFLVKKDGSTEIFSSYPQIEHGGAHDPISYRLGLLWKPCSWSYDVRRCRSGSLWQHSLAKMARHLSWLCRKGDAGGFVLLVDHSSARCC